MPLDPADPVLARETPLASRAALIVLDVGPVEAFVAARPAGAHRLPIDAREKAAKTDEGRLARRAIWAGTIGALSVDGTCPVHPAAFRSAGGCHRWRLAGAGAAAASGWADRDRAGRGGHGGSFHAAPGQRTRDARRAAAPARGVRHGRRAADLRHADRGGACRSRPAEKPARRAPARSGEPAASGSARCAQQAAGSRCSAREARRRPG